MATIGRARAVAQIRRLHLSGLVAWLAWAFVHLWYLVGFRNRLAVFLNWIWAYLISNHGARIVIGRGSRQPPVSGWAPAARRERWWSEPPGARPWRRAE